MKVSVVIPIYNTSKYIERCLNSAIAQTLNDIEIIAVDDGSTDNCYDIIEKYAEQYSFILPFKIDHRGLSYARNYGISHANGDYIICIDSDDYMREDMLERMYEKLIATGSEMAVCDFKYIYKGKSQQSGLTLDIGDSLKVGFDINILKDIFLNRLYFSNSVFNKMYKTDFIRNSHIEFEDESIIFAEDALYYHKIITKVKKIAIVNEVLYYYVQREGSLINSFDEKRIDKLSSFANNLIAYYDSLFHDYELNNAIICFIFDCWIIAVSEAFRFNITYAQYIKFIMNDYFKSCFDKFRPKDTRRSRRIFLFFFRRRMYHITYLLSVLNNIIKKGEKI